VTPRLLDLFSGAGGAARGYQNAGWHVTGVDVAEQPRYAGDEFVHGDAVAFLAAHGNEYDAIHASPPCQSFTAYRRRGQGVGDGYRNLIPVTRALLEHVGRPYVIENVPGAPLIDPTQLCGSSFGLDVRRHRLFEAHAFTIPPVACDHGWQTPRFPPATNRTNLRRTVEVGVYRIPLPTQRVAMGVDWPMTRQELSESIPPAYTEHIGRALINAISSRAAA